MNVPVSVIVPVYNKEKYLVKATESIINQTYLPMEIIFVDDCSSDESVKVICELKKKYPIIELITLNENSGVSCARNIGAKHAKYDVITFMDADDYYSNTKKIENEYKLYTMYTEKGIRCCVYSKIVLVDDNEKRIKTCKPNRKYLQGDIFTKLLEWIDFATIQRDYLVSKSAFFNVGGYNEKRSQFEDLELLFALARNNMFYCTCEEGTAYRQTGTGLSVDKNGSLKKNFDEVIQNCLRELPFDIKKSIIMKRSIRKRYVKLQKKIKNMLLKLIKKT